MKEDIVCQAFGVLRVGAIMLAGLYSEALFLQVDIYHEASIFLLPMGDIRFDKNWHTMGLAGTGSKNSLVTDAFVPAHRVVAVSDLLAGTTPGADLHNNPLYRQSMLSALPFALVVPLLGAAQGALADFIGHGKGPDDARRRCGREQSHGGVRDGSGSSTKPPGRLKRRA